MTDMMCGMCKVFRRILCVRAGRKFIHFLLVILKNKCYNLFKV